jgi:hypothetical protein
MPNDKLSISLINLEKITNCDDNKSNCEHEHEHKHKEKNIFAKICCDNSGNLYILTNDLYAIEIDRYNMPVFYKVKKEQYEIADTINYKRLMQKAHGSKLKEKMIDEMFDPYLKAPEEELDDCDEENKIDIDALKHYKYFPEDKYYDLDNTTHEKDEKYDEDSEYFKFYGECAFIKTDFCNSIYDSVIIAGNISSNVVSFRSELIGDNTVYRIVLYTDGSIMVNVVGSEKTISILTYDGENIIAKCKTKIHEI